MLISQIYMVYIVYQLLESLLYRQCIMDSEEFRKFGKAAIDYLADYFDTIRNRPVNHSVKPGYLRELIPDQIPTHGEPWQNVLHDIDRIIMPGITHWHNPNFHGYFAAANSFPAIIGEMMGSGITSIGLNWMASPAYTELEVEMMNWLGKLLGLPNVFLNSSEGPGGGALQGSASETTFLCLLTAKERKVQEILDVNHNLDPMEIKSKLVAYSSDQSNSSVEKAGLLGSMPIRLLPCDANGSLRASTLQEAIRKDKSDGLIPCYVVGCLGTTPTCAFDDLTEIGPVCQKEKVWLHIDAAYAGAAFACPEYRHLLAGVEYADSFNFNPHKWMLVNYDCSAMWMKDATCLVNSFNVDRIYLKVNKLPLIPEYRHWQIPLGRRFRSLKLWFVLRIYGADGIQQYIRKHISLAKYFESLVKSDKRFEIVSSNLGLICFRLKGDDAFTEKLLSKVEERGKIFVIAGNLNNKKMIRFAICSRYTEKCDVEYGWNEFLTAADMFVPNRKRKHSEPVEDNIFFSKNMTVSKKNSRDNCEQFV